MESEYLAKVIKQASDFAEIAPEKYRKETYQAVLNSLLFQTESSDPSQGTGEKRWKEIPSFTTREKMLETITSTNIDFSKYNEILKTGTWVERSLVVISAVEDNFQVNGLTIPEISSIMKNNLGVSSVQVTNLSRDLATSDLVSRSKEGRAYKYTLNADGQKHLLNLLQKNHEKGA